MNIHERTRRFAERNPGHLFASNREESLIAARIQGRWVPVATLTLLDTWEDINGLPCVDGRDITEDMEWIEHNPEIPDGWECKYCGRHDCPECGPSSQNLACFA